MAWRPTRYLQEGELDNTHPGKVTGWMKFAGMKEKVMFDLEGNFHRDIRGAKIRFKGDDSEDDLDAVGYMQGFARPQTGRAGDITAGLAPQDYGVQYPYIEWYSEQNGRVVLELESDQIEIIGTPIPACESDPISREEQNRNMAEFLGGLARELNIPAENAICVGGTPNGQSTQQCKVNRKIRGMKLLTEEIRKKLPPLYSQDGKGGKAVAYVKFFTPDSGFTLWITEGSPIKDENGREVDFHFFGLVQGQFKELGYFSLKELEEARGPMGLPIERDLHWRPKTLEEIAPEIFKSTGKGGD